MRSSRTLRFLSPALVASAAMAALSVACDISAPAGAPVASSGAAVEGAAGVCRDKAVTLGGPRNVRQAAGAFADFNGDGIPDMVGGGPKGAQLGLGRGDGTFERPTVVGSAVTTYGTTAADFDGDGRVDLAVSDGHDTDNLTIYLGHGDGTFGAGQVVKSKVEESSGIPADFDGDGVLDLAVASFDQVGILLGHGDGTFSHSATVSIPDTWTIAVGDLDGDGHADLVATTDKSTRGDNLFLEIMLGDGAGGLGAPQEIALGPGFGYDIEAADVDLDGVVDLVVSCVRTVFVLQGQGGGRFGAPTLYSTPGGGMGFAIGDVDGDGVPDIVTSGTRQLTVLRGTGGGAFAVGPAMGASSILGGGEIHAVDLDRDGKLDVTLSLDIDPSLGKETWIALGHGDGTFAMPAATDLGRGARSITAADFDGDGRADVVAALGTGGLWSLAGKGDGTFQAPVSLGTEASAFVRHADLDGDGRIDLASLRGDDVLVWLNAGGGAFAAPVGYPACTGVRDLLIRDVDHDGTPDAIVACEGKGTAAGAVAVLVGQGGGVLSAPVTYGSGPYRSVGFGDVDGDRIDDLVAVGGGVSVFHALGHGTFAAPVKGGPPGVQAGSFGDFNDDGVLDVAAVHDAGPYGAPKLHVLLGQGDGTFAESSVASAPWPCEVRALHADRDHRLDLVLTPRTDDDDAIVLFGKGDGTFQESVYPVATGPSFVASADFDGDGAPDLAFAARYDGAIDVLLAGKTTCEGR